MQAASKNGISCEWQNINEFAMIITHNITDNKIKESFLSENEINLIMKCKKLNNGIYLCDILLRP